MTQFSRVLFFANAAIIFCSGLAIFLLASSLRKKAPGYRVGRVALVPLVLGVGLVVGIVVLAGDRIGPLIMAISDGSFSAYSPALALPFAIAVAGLGALLGELALIVFPERISAVWDRRGPDRPSQSVIAGMTSAVLTLFLASVPLWVTSLEVVDEIIASRLHVEVAADYPLPEPPMDLEMVDSSIGYMTTATGSILRVVLSDEPDAAPTIAEVANGLVFPRGIAADGSTIYVADLGSMTCSEPFPTCFASTVDEEVEMINSSSGSLLAYEMSDDGSLAAPDALLTGLPAVSSEHGPNGVEVGPDGLVYLSIGNVDKLWEEPDRLGSLTQPNHDLLGTILRVHPASKESEVVATGTRNIYGFDFATSGAILAVDNDGPTVRGAYPESLLAVFGGEDFGYPEGGAWVDRSKTAPVWVLDLHGTSAVEFLETGPGSPGLLVGGPDRLTYIPLETDGDNYFVPFVEPVVDVLNIPGYVTAVELLPNGDIVIAVSSIYGGSGNRLMVLTTSGP